MSANLGYNYCINKRNIMGRNDLFGAKTKKYTGRRLMMFKDSRLYDDMKTLNKGQRAVLDFILKEMEEDLNTVSLGGDTRTACLRETGVSDKYLSNILGDLKVGGFIDKTALPNEYVVTPTLAVSGNERKVYANYARLEEELRKKNING